MRIEKGDIFKADVEAIIQQANCFCVMGAGFARVVALKWPEVALVDKQTKPGDPKKLGTITIAAVKDPVVKFVVNCYGQYRPGPDTRTPSLKLSLMTARKKLEELKVAKVGIPYLIGCGLGGGDEEAVLKAIEEAFKGSPLDVVIYKKD